MEIKKYLDFEYTVIKDEIKILKYLGEDFTDEVFIPEKIEEKAVTIIGSNCFKENGMMVRKIDLPHTIKHIENDAFSYAISLENLYLKSGLETIGADFLLATALPKIYIPSTVYKIERPELLEKEIVVDLDNKYYYSDGYGLYKKEDENIFLVAVNSSDERTSYTLYEKATHISYDSLRNVPQLKEITIEKNLKDIDEGAITFIGNKSVENNGLKNIVVSKENKHFIYKDTCLYKILEDKSLKLIRAFDTESLVLEENVSVIGSEALKNTRIKSLVVKNENLQIKEEVLFGSTLIDFTLENKYSLFFGGEDDFTHDKLISSFGKNNEIYDFSILDEFLLSEYLMANRVKMIALRLYHNYKLEKETYEKYFSLLSKNLKNIIVMLSKENDVFTIDMLGKIGLYTNDNILDLIDFMNKIGKKELTAWFMTFKNNELKKEEDEFLL